MFGYVIRRIFSGIAMLLVMSLVTFMLFFATPTDAARYTCGKNCTPELVEQNRRALGYDQPWVVQWGNFVKGIFVGREYPNDPSLRESAPQTVVTCSAPCLGYSPKVQQPVSEMIASRFPVSLSLALAAFVLWMIVGVGLGVLAALRKGTWIDRFAVGSALVVYAFPTFFIGMVLYTYVAIQWKLVPIPAYVNLGDDPVGWARGLTLPAVTLASVYAASYVRITRAFVIESLGEDYIRTAKAKGLPWRRTLTKHAMRAALTPIVTMAGLDLGGLLGGAIITETVFNYQGLGNLAVRSAQEFDLPVMVGLVVLLAAFIITANIVVDLLYAVIDPRVKLV